MEGRGKGERLEGKRKRREAGRDEEGREAGRERGREIGISE